jgi:hypothetical protein
VAVLVHHPAPLQAQLLPSAAAQQQLLLLLQQQQLLQAVLSVAVLWTPSLPLLCHLWIAQPSEHHWELLPLELLPLAHLLGRGTNR